MDPTSDTLELMIAAARAAGAGLARHFAKVSSLQIRRKGPADFVSAADEEAEAAVRAILSARRPDYGFMGEESVYRAGADPTRNWMVDPLDGTTNFLRGLPLFAVNIALEEAGAITAGVTFNPITGDLFTAAKGGGAFHNGAPIRVSGHKGVTDSVLAVGIPFAAKPRHDRFIAEMTRLTPHVAGIRRLGAAALDLAYVAAGVFDAYWEHATNAWDIAAGAILVTEAGGVVTGSNGAPFDARAGHILACTPGVQPELLKALRPT